MGPALHDRLPVVFSFRRFRIAVRICSTSSACDGLMYEHLASTSRATLVRSVASAKLAIWILKREFYPCTCHRTTVKEDVTFSRRSLQLCGIPFSASHLCASWPHHDGIHAVLYNDGRLCRCISKWPLRFLQNKKDMPIRLVVINRRDADDVL